MAEFERYLVSDRRLIGSRDAYGRTALHKAAKMGHVEIVEKLLNGDLSIATELAQATDRVRNRLIGFGELFFSFKINFRSPAALFITPTDARTT